MVNTDKSQTRRYRIYKKKKKKKKKIKRHQRFKSERHNLFTEEINKTILSSSDDKRIQSIGSREKVWIWSE